MYKPISNGNEDTIVIDMNSVDLLRSVPPEMVSLRGYYYQHFSWYLSLIF